MSSTQLNKSEWSGYFDRVSKAINGEQAEIEVASLALGNQIEANWLPLYGITYDPKSDVLEVVLEGLDHLIHRPLTVYVEADADGLSSMLVNDGDTQQLVRFRKPLQLHS
ncbi:DUF5335 domain-containing protein [Noviherbaspirillum galbum]|uniref:Uncharacterized protein n=1 Tax=Noviherbaspirillum galbum TaxID=2709383 RepID=A0A6B3SX88_9BURK|nr:DUF5335 domain-containing protein [Noviherbaspirillum galbum]NEX62359.1 hypothetical protein [Noviherbaspirillum galbum]